MMIRKLTCALILCVAQITAHAAQDKLKVCADPYMLPYSNAKTEGYENRIAELFAKDLGWELEYMFFPQRMGFIRNTLRAENEKGLGYKCDLVITVPEQYEMAATTIPYYATTYMLVSAKGSGYDTVEDPEKMYEYITKNNLQPKIGVTERGPAQLWVFYQEMMPYMTPYQGQPGDPKSDPGHTLIKDIVADKIQLAVVWGPTAGYYSKKYRDQKELVLRPLPDKQAVNREMIFSYNLSMAVRHGEKEWLDQINGLIEKNKGNIEKILKEHGVPLVEMRKTVKKDDDD